MTSIQLSQKEMNCQDHHWEHQHEHQELQLSNQGLVGSNDDQLDSEQTQERQLASATCGCDRHCESREQHQLLQYPVGSPFETPVSSITPRCPSSNDTSGVNSNCDEGGAAALVSFPALNSIKLDVGTSESSSSSTSTSSSPSSSTSVNNSHLVAFNPCLAPPSKPSPYHSVPYTVILTSPEPPSTPISPLPQSFPFEATVACPGIENEGPATLSPPPSLVFPPPESTPQTAQGPHSISTHSRLKPPTVHPRSRGTQPAQRLRSPHALSRPLSNCSDFSTRSSSSAFSSSSSSSSRTSTLASHPSVNHCSDSVELVAPKARYLAPPSSILSSVPTDQPTGVLSPAFFSLTVPTYPASPSNSVSTETAGTNCYCHSVKPFTCRHNSQQQQQQQQQQRPRRRRERPRSAVATEIQSLRYFQQLPNSSTVPSTEAAQAQGTLEYLNYLETCLPSEPELRSRAKQQRFHRLITVKEFLSDRLRGLTKKKSSSSLSHSTLADSARLIRPNHPNHSAPSIDRSLLSPSPSPSLPLPHQSVHNSLSHPSSTIPSSGSELGLVAQTRDRANHSANSFRGSGDRNSYVGGQDTRPSTLGWSESSLANIRTSGALATPSTTAGALNRPSPPSDRPTPSSSTQSLTPSTSTFSRLQPRFESSTSIATTTSSYSSSYTSSPMSPTCSSVSMSNYPSSSLSSLALHITPSSMPSNTGSSLVTSSQSTILRNPARKTNGGQHPLANVSTYDSDLETSSINETPECNGDEQSSAEDTISTISAPDTPNNGVIIPPVEVKGSIIPEGCSENGASKQSNTSMRKSAGKRRSSQVLILHLKPGMAGVETSAMANNTQAGVNHDGDPTTESEWTSVAVAASFDQPLSPLTGSYSTIAGRSVSVSNLEGNNDIAGGSPHSESLPTDMDTLPTPATTSEAPPSPRSEFEKWTPPPCTPRPTQDTQRQNQTLRQPHSRLQLSRLLKHRSLNFPFSYSGSSPSSQQHGAQSSPVARTPADGPVRPTGTEAAAQDHQACAPQSRDLPRPVGPPDPIPPHYQHLQNRQNRRSAAFRRRSHGELERFSPGWIAAENAAPEQRARWSISNDTEPQDSNQRRATVSRRHASLGLQPNLSSMWGRLLTSIFPSGSGSEHGDEQHYSDTNGSTGELPLRHQRLLLTPLSQQQQVHPIYQQQLFFYEDEVVDAPERSVFDNSIPLSQQHDEDSDNTSGIQKGSTSDPNSQRDNAALPSISMTSNVNLQAELAQEDGREDSEMMQVNDTVFIRPEIFGRESTVVPKSLSANGKISVSSLALSSPPSYWETAIKYKGWSKIETRPEQGQEKLPRYTCSVFREGCVNLKTELVGTWRPYRRPWKRTFAHLRGTALRLYAVDTEDVPRLHVRNISLQHAKCWIPSDYKQRTNVIRIHACDRTILLECKDRIDALTWLEHLQAAANIATSLEDRSMPKFYTLPRAQPHPRSGSRLSTNSTDSNQQQSSSSLSSSMDSQGPQQQQQQSSMDQMSSSQPQPQPQPQPIPPPIPQTRQQQMQQQLQEQQEQILMQQRVEQRLQRSQQFVVQSSDSGSIIPPLPPSPAAMSTSRRRGTARLERDHDQDHLRTGTGLMIRAERERNMTEAERRQEEVRQEEDAIMQSVLHALGQSSDSGSCHYDSDDIEDTDDNDRVGTEAETPATVWQDRARHHSSHDAGYRPPQYQQQQQHEGYVNIMPRNCRSQEFERSSEGNVVDSQRPQRRPQRASWNKRLFGGLWG